MEILHLNNDNFEESIKNDKALVVFTADWCPPCKAISIVLEDLVKETNTIIAKINIEKEPELSSKYKVYSVPTVMLFKNGEVIKTETGFKSKNGLKKFIEEEK